MADVISMRASQAEERPFALPSFLQREETAAQIVALMSARFSRPEPQEMLQILECARQQVTGLLP
jgi:hypothetical protein